MPRWTLLVPPALLASLLAAALPPGARAECRFSRGDLAPGELDASYAVPLWTPQGDGRIDVGDVIALLRSSVALQRLAVPRPEDGACPLVPGDFAPGELDESTVPPTWRVIGDGMIGVGDVVALLRSAVGLQTIAPPTERPELRPFAACRELEHWVKQTALQSLELYGAWSVAWWGQGPLGDGFLDGDAGPLPTAGGGESAASRSETNTQVEGVDEDDIVETDGRYLYVISSDGLRVVDAWPPESLRLVAHVPIEGRPTGAFLNGDRLLVLSTHWDAPRPEAGGLVALDPSLGLLKLSFFDVADPSSPLLLRELYVEGFLQAARRVDDRVLLVTHHGLRGPRMPDWTGDEDWRLALRRAVEDSGLDDWLPRSVDLVRQGAGWQRIARHVAGCTDLQRPDLPDGAGFTVLTTLDLQDPSFLGRNGIFAATGAVFANADRVELSSHAWPQGVWWGWGWGERPLTRLHSFDLGADLSAPRYFGSGEVPGSVLNQFSMDVREGLLRVATTTGTWSEPTNAVHVLERSSPPEKKALRVIGALDGLAPGETIQAVRFVGDIGWVVTFFTTDPLYAIDLSDPTRPTVSGELHVTGFSSYLHPIDGDHLIGVGTEVDPETGRQVGLQVSLFDVSDPSSPQLAARDVIATGASSSEAQQDHHAFTWSGEHEALALPVVHAELGASGWNTGFNGLRLYRMDPVAGIERLGDLSGVESAPGTDPYWNPWCGQVRRSVFLEDKVYAVSELGVVVASLDDLEHPLAQLSFERPNGCWY